MGPLTRRLAGTLTALLVVPVVLAAPTSTARTDDDPALAGTPVAGSRDPRAAPPLTTGRYLDRLPTDGPLHYRLPRAEDGTTFHVAALFVGAGDSVGEGLRLEVGTTPGGQGCGSSGVFRPTLGEQDPVLLTSVSTWTDVADHECAVAEDLHLSLGVPRDPADAGRPVEILVYEEPPLSQYSFDLLPEPEAPAWTPLTPSSPPRRVAVGTTPTDAPVVGDGTYALALRPGRTAVLAVPLDWDQSLAAQLDVRLPAGAPHPEGISVDVVGPMLGTSQVSFDGDAPPDWTARPRPGAPLRTGAQSQVVSYPHRDSYDATINTASLAGIHHVVVTWTGTDATADVAPAGVRATLTVATTGAAGPGVPAYTPVEGPIGPQAGSRLVDGTLREPVEASRDEPVADGRTDRDEGRIVPLALAAAAAGAVVLLVLRRRSTRPAGRDRAR